ncbi:MAG: hypothetical protein NTZ63_01365 [Candidatus Omnitrophica bacterium]|nr:hypothetical protein [Candidatus Omnitrophota bacterium]
MFKVIEVTNLNKEFVSIGIEARDLVKKIRPGQFISIITKDTNERIPLRLADWDADNGEINIIFRRTDYTAKNLERINEGDAISELFGPLGQMSKIEKLGEVYFIADDNGLTGSYPILKALKAHGNRIISIIETQDKPRCLLEDKIREVSSELLITDKAINTLKDLFQVIEKSTHTQYPKLIYCMGSIPMMKEVAEFSAENQIKTILSLDPVLVDTTGICGTCSCKTTENKVFKYSDGPDFDATDLDLNELAGHFEFLKHKRLKDTLN